MNDAGNAVTNGVRNDGVTLPHTTPHHTTPLGTPTSSRNDALARGRANEESTTATVRDIHPLDAVTAAVCSLRPEWAPERVRTVLARDRRSWHDVVAAALRAALDPDVRHPGAIENHDSRDYSATPTPMRLADWRTAERCVHGAIHDPHPCALCRAGVQPEGVA